jgi:hypothetical protein
MHYDLDLQKLPIGQDRQAMNTLSLCPFYVLDPVV